MVPDKIYIWEHNIEAGNIQDLNELVVEGSTEYIRKDALLQWVKDLKHIYEIPINNCQPSKLCCAKAEAFQLVIEKIESL